MTCISKECIISPKFWSGLVISTVNIAVNFYNTLLIISTVDCREFHQAFMSEKI